MKPKLYTTLAVLLTAILAPAATPLALAQSPAKRSQKNDAGSAKRLSVPIVLTDGVNTVKRTRKELGFALASQSPVSFSVDKARLKDALTSISKGFRAEAVNARPVIYKGQVVIKPGRSARALNVPTTAEKIASGVEVNPATARFTVALDKKPPVLTAERLKGINARLSNFSTRAGGTSARDTNISIAVNDINGILLSPGETFSLNEAVGKRTKAKGYKEAPVFVNAKKVPGLGGGVSQVTGTLFNAAALAGLNIIEVNPHSRPVAYLPIGRDATVVYGAKDLRFKNNTQAPVLINYTFRGNRLTATFWGKKVPGRRISLRTRAQRLGEGKINAQLYRVTKVNGKVTSKERLFGHAYRWKPGADPQQ